MPTTLKAHPHKNSLDIRLAESVVFLRAGDATGRQRNLQADAPPGMVRGLLVLNLAKPTRITSIEIELVGKTVTAWPEGVGARRIEITEEHEIYSQSYVFFRAGQTPGAGSRRNLSVGPGLSLEHEDEDHSERSSYVQHDGQTEEDRGRSPYPHTMDHNRNHRRYMSVDQTHFQRSFVSHRQNTELPANLPLTPPYTPTYSPEATPHLSPTTTVMQRSPFGAFDESPARSLDDLRRAFQTELEGEHHQYHSFAYDRTRSQSRTGAASSASILSRPPDSRRVSFDDDREFQVGSSASQLPQRMPSQPPVRGAGSRTPSRQREADGDDRGRKNKPFTFASALLEAMKDRVRSKSPLIEREAHHGEVTPPRGRARDRVIMEEPEKPILKELSALGRVGEALGFDVDDGREHGDGWKEFRRGVYTYPISFAIPANSPPSLHVDYGSVAWKLKAVVHRPGAFKAKLQTSHDITVVTTPCEDDTEESESIIVERQWDTQMQYLIAISGRSFPLGGTIPISITFMPWTKMKIHRVSVLIEERVDYWTQFKRISRTDPIIRNSLLALKYAKKDGPPILPLLSDDPDAFRQSPLIDIIDPSDDLGQVVSNLMGPGPWTIRKNLQLPKTGESLHTTNKNKRSNISVSHMLKIIFRVERGDDCAVDPQTGKRKLFDIVVQTPVHILSHLCNPDYISLPPYSQLPDPAATLAHHPTLSILTDGDIHVGVAPIIVSPAHLRDGSHTPIRSPSMSIHPSTTNSLSGAAPSPGVLQRRESGLSDDSLPSGAQSPIGGPGGAAIAATVSPPLSRRHSLERSTTELFEQLIAGEVSEEGEAPPSYAVAVEGIVNAHMPPSNASH
ncbi:hypothetical protein TRAPUB_3706 [Trametes pubescens]|uniref:Arrestin C-terminal-like domain-containing protein n=1 Tax=Trametes pubescens TaxID=154538 RepID=A0A1M2VD71_TRAPU|nr:hypothetical protein TRAPUB_3706 [Trametes pubescens]